MKLTTEFILIKDKDNRRRRNVHFIFEQTLVGHFNPYLPSSIEYNYNYVLVL